MSSTKSAVHFFDLPQEVRDMIYLYFRPYRWVTITEMPNNLLQPTIAQVSKQVRKESLDVFYGKNRFMLDMRGWKHSTYPKSWSPIDIFHNWITAIGDENAARLRNISFYLHNFAVHYTINPDRTPRITAKFRQTRSSSPYMDIAEEAPKGYTFDMAISRAKKRLTFVTDNMNDTAEDQQLSVVDFLHICAAIENIQPALCTRIGVGWKGAVLSDDPAVPPNVHSHRASCGECGYHRLSDDSVGY